MSERSDRIALTCLCGLMAFAVLAGCVDEPAVCPNDLPDSCVNSTSWSVDVAPVVSAKCAVCHGPQGVEAARPFTTYADVFARKGAVLGQIYACLMPQADSGYALTPAERKVLLQWLVCGAPNN